MYDEKTLKCTYNTGDILAVTIAPDDKIQQFLKQTRLSDFNEYYTKKFEILTPPHFNHWFRIELSEPIGEIQSEGPRLHLHGIIQLKTKLAVFKYLFTLLPDLLQHARLEVHHMDTHDKVKGWIKYCSKQIDYMPKNSVLTNFHDSPCGEELCSALCKDGESVSPAPERGGGRKGVGDDS